VFEKSTGFTSKILLAVDANDLAFIIRLQVALGRALATAHQMTESVTAFQDALRVGLTCIFDWCLRVLSSNHMSLILKSIDRSSCEVGGTAEKSLHFVSCFYWVVFGPETWSHCPRFTVQIRASNGSSLRAGNKIVR
jgi:hypothetical protein